MDLTVLHDSSIISYDNLLQKLSIESSDNTLLGTTKTFYLSESVSDDYLTMLDPWLLDLTFMDDCKNTVLDPFTIPDITMVYTDPQHNEVLTVPTDSVGLANLPVTPLMCGERFVITIEDIDTGTVSPAYLSTIDGSAVWDKTLQVVATGEVDIGTHNIRIT